MIKRSHIGVCAAALLLVAGCASFDGHGLVEKGASAADVEALMGSPAARVAKADGGSVLYYPRLPIGRSSYAVTLGPDAKVNGVEQLLTMENISRLKPGEMSTRDVRELIGPTIPSLVSRLSRQQRDVWEYPWMNFSERRILAVQFSDDGVLREVINLSDDYYRSPGGLR